MKDLPDDRQIIALQELIGWLNQRYQAQNPAGMEVKLHREVAKTSCPGELFPEAEIRNICTMINQGGKKTMEDWKSQLLQQARQAGLITDDHHPDDPAPKWFVLAVALHLLEKVTRPPINKTS